MNLTTTAHPDASDATATPVYVPTAKLAELLACHVKTINRLARRGIIPLPIVLGGLRRWDLHRVLAAMQRSVVA